MFIPFNKPNKLVYCYDVNALYPYILKTKPISIDKPTYFKGDIMKYPLFIMNKLKI